MLPSRILPFLACALAVFAWTPATATDWDAARDLKRNELLGPPQELTNPNPTVLEWSYGYRNESEIASTKLTMGLKALPKHSGEYLLEVIMRRYENRSTIMTSNRPLEEWGKLLGDVPAAGAILDRFLHHAQVIAIKGRSYRVKDSPVLRSKSKEPETPAAAGDAS